MNFLDSKLTVPGSVWKNNMVKLKCVETICNFNAGALLQVVKNNLNPIWKPFRIPVQSLCGGDVEKPIKVNTHSHTCRWTSGHRE